MESYRVRVGNVSNRIVEQKINREGNDCIIANRWDH